MVSRPHDQGDAHDGGGASKRLVDGVLVVLDARAPAATVNKKLNRLFGGKPVLYILNKADLADDKKTDASLSAFAKAGRAFARQMRGDLARVRRPRDRRARRRELLREKFARKDEAEGAWSRAPQTDGLRRAEHGQEQRDQRARAAESAPPPATRRASRGANSGSAVRGSSSWIPRAPCRRRSMTRRWRGTSPTSAASTTTSWT